MMAIINPNISRPSNSAESLLIKFIQHQLIQFIYLKIYITSGVLEIDTKLAEE